MSKLDELLRTITKQKIFIQTHNYPDQDALASAFGLQELLRHRGIDSVICYQGQIDKVNTLKMVELLGIELYQADTLTMGPDDEIVIVDGQKGNINVHELISTEIACIDHHPKQATDMYRFYDIRKVGACATIIGTYFLENELPISKKAATALVYGIKVDTANLMRQATQEDADMFCHLYKQADISMLREFESSVLQVKDLRAYKQALDNLRLYEPKIGVADVGENCSEAMLGTVSDFLMSLEEVKFSLVYSRRAGGLKFSLRNELEGVDASELIRCALEDFLGGGGGHAAMAAGFIPNLTEEEAEAAAEQVIKQIVEQVQHKL